MDSTTVSTPGAGSLGTITNIVVREGDEVQIKALRWVRQAVSRRLLPDERVGFCLCKLFGNSMGVTVMHSKRAARAYYGNLLRCGSVWLCPVCSSRISSARREELHRAISSWGLLGGRVYLATYTFRHKRSMDLSDEMELMGMAYRKMSQGKGYRALRETALISYTVRALEVTWSQGDGWHAHMHVLLFVGPGAPAAQVLENSLYPLWEKAAGSVGLSMTRAHGVRVDGDRDGAADYVAKFGRDRSESAWGPADELTRWHYKTGSLKGDGERHYSPFELLDWVLETGEALPAALWREYASAMKGHKQLVLTPGMREALAMGPLQTDEQLAEEDEPDGRILALILPEEWRAILYFERRGEVLQMAACGRSEPVLGLVQGIYREYLHEQALRAARASCNAES